MAIPTSFGGYTPSANTTKSFKIFGSATTGIWANDVDGTLSAACQLVTLAPNLGIFMSQAYTDAQIIALLQQYLRDAGAFTDGAAGGRAAQATKQILPTATTCT
jgi:hypothetical protein